MTERKLRFALFGNTFQERKAAAVQKLLAVLMAHEAEISIEEGFYQFMTLGLQIHVPECQLIHTNNFSSAGRDVNRSSSKVGRAFSRARLKNCANAALPDGSRGKPFLPVSAS